MSEHSLLLETPPRGWTAGSFGDVCIRVQDAASPTPNGQRLYLGLEHLASGFPSLVGRGWESEVRSGKTAFRKGDVLFGKLRPYLRKSVLVSEDGICSTDILVFRTSEKSLPEFLCLLTHSDEFAGHAKATTSGVQHPRTSWASLREFKLHVPPLAEQRKIAGVLGVVQRALEQQERLIALTTELKKVLLYQLFTQGLRGEPQKQTEIGPVPQSWEVVTIGDLFKFSSGKSRPDDTELTASESRPFPVFGGNGVLGYSSRYLVEEPLLLIGRVGEYCGCAHHTAGRAWVSDNALYAKEILRETNTRYAAEYFSYANLNQYRNQAGQPLITQGVISKVRMPLPPIDQQREILEPLTLLNQKLSVSKRKHAALTALFRTLLHQLMTAQIRVDKLDIEELNVGIS